MNKSTRARYLLYILLAAFVGWLLWLLPLPLAQPPVTATRHTSWLLPAINRPADPKKLAAWLARRQGWRAAGVGGTGRAATAKKNTAKTQILGIVRPAQGAAHVLILLPKGKLRTVTLGETLPDGRRVTAIEAATVTLAPAKDPTGKPQTIHLFPYQPKQLTPPPAAPPATAS